MKRFYSLLLFVFLASLMAIAQQPCGWFPGLPVPDQATLDANLRHIKCNRVDSLSSPPIFDADNIARIDDVWYDADTVNISRHRPSLSGFTSTPDPNINAVARFMYDANYLYVLVVVSGDLDVDATGNGNINNQDYVELMFQNTYGGKGTAVDHFGDVNFANWYWMEDGDRKWIMPLDRASSKIEWLDQDLNNDGVGTDCGEVVGDDWLVLMALEYVKYNVSHSNDTIIYEMAFSLKNWLKYSNTYASELEGHKFGLDISVHDIDADVMNDVISLNDLGNNAWAWAPAIAEFTFDTVPKHFVLTNSVIFTVTNGVNPISGAQVVLNNSAPKTTNTLGQVVFNDVDHNNYMNVYNVTAAGFYDKYSDLGQVNNDRYVTITLDSLPPKTYSVYFTVDDGSVNVSGAQITFNSETKYRASLKTTFFDAVI